MMALERKPDQSDAVVERYKCDVDRTLIRQNLRKTVQERVDSLIALQALATEARRAGEKAREAFRMDRR